MISDVLCDAVVEITRYQTEMPDIYSEHYERIERVKLEMDLLRHHFDRPPNCKEIDSVVTHWCHLPEPEEAE